MTSGHSVIRHFHLGDANVIKDGTCYVVLTKLELVLASSFSLLSTAIVGMSLSRQLC